MPASFLPPHPAAPPLSLDQAFQVARQHHQAHQFPQAESLYRQILTQQPQHPDALRFLGIIAFQKGQPDLALDLLHKTLALFPHYAEAHNNLGMVLLSQGHRTPAIVAFQQAMHLKPDYADAQFNLANALQADGQLDAAIAAFQRAIALNPHNPEAYNNLGVALRALARLDEAITAYRQALALKPDYAAAHSNLLFLLPFHSAYDGPTIVQENRLWDLQHAAPLARQIKPHTNDRNPDRPLRVGYVSRFFRNHCQSFFTVPLLSHHDRSAFPIFCYSDTPNPDPITARLQSHAAAWRTTTTLPDPALADLIRADNIDILVDLTMHMGGSRLLAFARKPAPVQIAYLAYPGTTGLSTMDYRFTDPHLDPPTPPNTHDDWYTERSLRLPDSFWCYDPLTDAPAITPLPAATHGHFTFGCLNTFSKINNAVLSLWARVLHAVPNSRLLWLTGQGSHAQNALHFLQQQGIDPRRIECLNSLPREKYLQHYHHIDLILDTFPSNGHTTTFDALFMGVPVVTLVGPTAVGRGGLSILSTLGLPELIAHTPDQYLAIATHLALDLSRLAHLRATLRPRMQASPLMDAPRFAKNVESLYRQIWQSWCTP